MEKYEISTLFLPDFCRKKTYLFFYRRILTHRVLQSDYNIFPKSTKFAIFLKKFLTFLIFFFTENKIGDSHAKKSLRIHGEIMIFILR